MSTGHHAARPEPPPEIGDSSVLQAKKIIVCVTGGIAAYKTVELVRDLAQLGSDVHVVMTPSAQQFVTGETFAAISGNRVSTELFAGAPDAPHVELARGAHLLIVAPATANSLARMATGIADDLFLSTFLMVRCPVIVAPAMHTQMWEHPATQEHVSTLIRRGVRMVGPASGALMSGDVGPGRMAEPQEIVAAAGRILELGQQLAGKRALITGGGTQEPIDAVRYIGNRSSGLMGIELALEAQMRGAKVTLVLAAAGGPVPEGIELVEVRTADEMRDAVLHVAPDADIIVMAAAVSDFKPSTRFPEKLKKSDGAPQLTLVETPDILAELGATPSLRKPGGVLAGFAAETEAHPARLAELAKKKLSAKGADVIVANDVVSADSGFGAKNSRAVIASSDRVVDVGLATKSTVAQNLLDAVSELLERRQIG